MFNLSSQVNPYKENDSNKLDTGVESVTEEISEEVVDSSAPPEVSMEDDNETPEQEYEDDYDWDDPNLIDSMIEHHKERFRDTIESLSKSDGVSLEGLLNIFKKKKREEPEPEREERLDPKIEAVKFNRTFYFDLTHMLRDMKKYQERIMTARQKGVGSATSNTARTQLSNHVRHLNALIEKIDTCSRNGEKISEDLQAQVKKALENPDHIIRKVEDDLKMILAGPGYRSATSRANYEAKERERRIREKEAKKDVKDMSANESYTESEEDDEENLDDMSWDEIMEEAQEAFMDGPNLYELIAMESRYYKRAEKKEDKKYGRKIRKLLKAVQKNINHCRDLKKLNDLERTYNKEKNKYQNALNNMKDLTSDMNSKNITKAEYKDGMDTNRAQLDQQLTILRAKDFGEKRGIGGNDLKAFQIFCDRADQLFESKREYLSKLSIDKSEKKNLKKDMKEEVKSIKKVTGRDFAEGGKAEDYKKKKKQQEEDYEEYEEEEDDEMMPAAASFTAIEGCVKGKGCESIDDDEDCEECDDEYEYEDEDGFLDDYDDDDPFIEGAYQSYLKEASNGQVAQENKGRTPRKKPLTKKEYFLAMCKARKIKDKNARQKTIDGIKSGNYTVDDAVDSGLLLRDKKKKKANEAVTIDGIRIMTAEDEGRTRKKNKKSAKESAADNFIEYLDQFNVNTDLDAMEAVSTSEISRRLRACSMQYNTLLSMKSKKTPNELASNASDIIRTLDGLASDANSLEDAGEKNKVITQINSIKSKLKSIAGKAYVKAAKEMFSDIDEDEENIALEEANNNTAEENGNEAEESVGAKKDTYWTGKADSIEQKILNRIKHADTITDKEEAINILEGAKSDAKDLDDHLDTLDMETYRRMTSGSDEKKSSLNDFRKEKRSEVDKMIKQIDQKLKVLKGDAATESLDRQFDNFFQAFSVAIGQDD